MKNDNFELNDKLVAAQLSAMLADFLSGKSSREELNQRMGSLSSSMMVKIEPVKEPPLSLDHLKSLYPIDKTADAVYRRIRHVAEHYTMSWDAASIFYRILLDRSLQTLHVKA